MIIIFLITAFVILLYIIYPLWLLTLSPHKPDQDSQAAEINTVSLILLSYNGKPYLTEKINFLIRELSGFQLYELIIIDDNSSDGSQEVIENFRGKKNIRLIYKSEHKGIPHSMNLGVSTAQYDTIIFCDQRQALSDNILTRLVEPLKYIDIGSVSACMSHQDLENCNSLVRRFENYIKKKESKAGSLMGVYGPLYAIRKDSYSIIPEHIILDDLYLSLKIMKSKQIRILNECKIIDRTHAVFCDYQRARRYIIGFLQIMKEKGLVSELNYKQCVMLLWHKYLRLLIPLFLLLSYIGIGILGFMKIECLIMFFALSVLSLMSVMPAFKKNRFPMKNIIRMNIFYCLGLFDVFCISYLKKQFPAVNSDKILDPK